MVSFYFHCVFRVSKLCILGHHGAIEIGFIIIIIIIISQRLLVHFWWDGSAVVFQLMEKHALLQQFTSKVLFRWYKQLLSSGNFFVFAEFDVI